ncbi:hypothetical protein HXX76_005569 [Chlamydomonas incerta]|uniref:Isopenicillin N synthase-like Fe(2+) 2OG dioxygenase domain-containing protein n=1 Tax=Chlamydomonas incerta TaxID=51695 RepID=A0A835W5K1_CHLIN|nr:hypothetical protein HXX76_005569 [Chlamydomonas incerta]|eukprot:KAG2437954.1 hypothetical protein HXX76_005569 [Chlamydomonas incerta]
MQQGVAVLELGSDEEFAPFTNALEACADFFANRASVKQGAQSAVPGEGYAVRPGKELLALRPGSSAWGSGRLRATQAALHQASSLADRGLLSALCRSPALDLHSGQLLGLLDDAPLLGQASASLLRGACYSPDPHAAQLLAFAPHHDRGVLTLVASAQEWGLQVQVGKQQHPQQKQQEQQEQQPQEQAGEAGSDEWVDVPLGPGRVAVLCGYSLSYELGGLLQPALHRVQPPTATASAGAAAITQWAATRLPAADLEDRPALLVSALMERFEAAHPVSINGGLQLKREPGADTPPARRQREENAGGGGWGASRKAGCHDGGRGGGPGEQPARRAHCSVAAWARRRRRRGTAGGGAGRSMAPVR